MNKLVEMWQDGYTHERAAHMSGLDPLVIKILWEELNR